MAWFLFGLHVSKSSLKTNVRYWHKADMGWCILPITLPSNADVPSWCSGARN
jgi:hypothetical protein